MVTIQTAAQKRAADDARIAAARAAHAVQRIDSVEAPAAPAPILTLGDIIARNAAREMGIPEPAPTPATPSAPPRTWTPTIGWRNPRPGGTLGPHVRRTATKRSAAIGTWQSCKTTRVYFSQG